MPSNDHTTHISPWIPLSMVSSHLIRLSIILFTFHFPLARRNLCSPRPSPRPSSSTTTCSYFDHWRRIFPVDVNVEVKFLSACEKTGTASTTTPRGYFCSLCNSSILSRNRRCIGTDNDFSEIGKRSSSAHGRSILARVEGGK